MLVYLKLGEREATASSYATVVFDAWAAHYWPELVNWARSDCCCFCETGIAAARFASGLNMQVRSVFRALCGGAVASSKAREVDCVPDRSGCGHGAANPYGNLYPRLKADSTSTSGASSRLCCIC